jgi:hypothetical protein
MPDLTGTPLLTSGRPTMSSMWGWSPRWLSEVDFYVPEDVGSLRDIVRLCRMARRHDHVVLRGSVNLDQRYRDLWVALGVRVLPRSRRPQVLITDATWEPRSRALGRLLRVGADRLGAPVKLVIRAIDGPHVTYGVLSSEEVHTFPRTWGIDPARVVFTPFSVAIDPDMPSIDGDYVFSGGNSLRDYVTLERAVHGLDVPVVVASSWQPDAPVASIRAGLLSKDHYDAALAGAGLVVVPLERAERSAGQQTYLAGMALRKTTIVSDAFGVRDHIEDGVTGVIVPPADPEALRAAIVHALDPANAQHYREMGERARNAVLERFSYAHYWGPTLLDAIGA